MMGSIYRQAAEVLVWFGPERDGSDLAMQTLRSIAYSLRERGLFCDHESLMDEKIVASPEMASFVENMFTQLEAGTKIPLSKIEHLVDHSWWKRVWVIQEVILADSATIVCGCQSLSWQDLFAVCMIFRNLSALINSTVGFHGFLLDNLRKICSRSFPIIYMWSDFRASGRRGLSLLNLLDYTCIETDFQSADPKDRVYGVLALMPEHFWRQILVDYSEFTIPVRVFTVVAILMLREYGIKVLNYCQPGMSRFDELPSWVPDWTSSLLFPIAVRFDRYSAAGTSLMAVAEAEKAAATGCLVLSGIRADTVDGIGSKFKRALTAGNEEQWLSDFEAWLREFEYLLPQVNDVAHQPIGYVNEALWRKLIGDRINNRKAQAADQFGYRVLAGLEKPPQEYKGGITQWRLDMSASYRHNLMRLQGRKVFITRGGYIGLGPAEIRCSDNISIILGGKTPFIIRSGGNEKFRLIGEAYVHGMMEGEMMERNLEVEKIALY